MNNSPKVFKTFFTEKNLYLLLFLFLWIYIWLRSIFTQLTHDETATFFRYIQLAEFLPFSSDLSANNHILNSLLSYLFYSVLGPHTLVLRLANILSFPIFFYFLIKVGQIAQNQFLRISFVIILAFTHNFIEFFGLSRGYGLSMAFLMPAIWHLTQALQGVESRDYLLTLAYSVVALSANLTLLNTLIIFITLLILRLITYKNLPQKKLWKHWLYILVFGLGPLLFFTIFLFALKGQGELYYGLTTGFWEVTVRTIASTMLDPDWQIFELFIGIYTVFILIFGSYFFFRSFNIERLFSKHLLFFYLLLGNVAAAILLKYLFGVNYPEDRTGLYFVLYFFGSIIFISDLLLKTSHKKNFRWLILPLFFMPLHFFATMNFSHNSFESHNIPVRFYDEISSSHKPGEAPPTIGGYMGREFRWAFLNFKRGGKLGKIHGSLYPSRIEDYQIVNDDYFANWNETYDSVDFQQSSGFYLLKRKEDIPQKLIVEKSGISSKGIVELPYNNILQLEVDSLAGKNLQLIFKLNFNTTAKPFKSWLVATVRNAQNQETGYEYFALDWLKYDWSNGAGQILNSMIVPLPEDAHILKFYLWNIQQIPFELSDGTVQVLEYEMK